MNAGRLHETVCLTASESNVAEQTATALTAASALAARLAAQILAEIDEPSPAGTAS